MMGMITAIPSFRSTVYNLLFFPLSSVLGVVGQETLITQIVSMNRQQSDPAIKALNKRVIRLNESEILGKLARVLEVDPSVLILGKNPAGKVELKALATKLDVTTFIAAGKQKPKANGTTNGGSH